MATMEAAYGGLSSDCSVDCYMKKWTKSGGVMATWSPSGQTFADYIDYEHSGITYLIGLGNFDGSVKLVKLDGTGGGNVAGYAYSRVEVDYTGSAVSTRTMKGFGAG